MVEKCISITKVQIGHVVGKGGATIREIQEKSGAKLEIIDGPQVKITADDDAKVAVAEEEVKKIVANQESPDYEGPDGARLRKEANDAGDRRSKLFDEATAKRNAGDHEGANKLVAEAKASGEVMEQKHREASRAIAKYNNEDKGKGDDYFDMHGLHEEEAMEMLKERVAVLEAKPAGTVTDFEVIPGAGHHSAPGKQKLKGATEAYLKEKKFVYEEASAGSFVVKVPGTGAEAPAKKTKTEEDAATPAVGVEPVPAAAPAAEPPAAKKPEETKPSEKKPEEKKLAEEKKPEEKKAEEKKPEEKKKAEGKKDKKDKKKGDKCCVCM